MDILRTINVNDAVFFYYTLVKNEPYIPDKPRNHESLGIITKGALMYEKNDERVVIKEGQVAYIAKGAIDKSSAYECDEVSYMAVNFSFGGEASAWLKNLPFDTLCGRVNTYKFRELFKTALNECSLGQPGSQIICAGILYQMIGTLYNAKAFGKLNAYDIERTEKSTEYLQENYSRTDLTIALLAESSGLSEKQYRRLFLKLYNKHPYEFLRDFRLNESKILLLNNSKAISDIALECGFSDIYAFSHCFKKNIGISPREYRKRMK